MAETQVYWFLEFDIKADYAEFLKLVNDMVVSTQAEKDTTGYEWSISEGHKKGQLFERYRNSDAVLLHMQGISHIQQLTNGRNSYPNFYSLYVIFGAR